MKSARCFGVVLAVVLDGTHRGFAEMRASHDDSSVSRGGGIGT